MIDGLQCWRSLACMRMDISLFVEVLVQIFDVKNIMPRRGTRAETCRWASYRYVGVIHREDHQSALSKPIVAMRPRRSISLLPGIVRSGLTLKLGLRQANSLLSCMFDFDVSIRVF
jgi:hypothetical protein